MLKLIISWVFYSYKNLLFRIFTINKFYFFFTHRKVKFVGARALDIGKNSVIGDGSWININLPKKFNLKIGKNCTLGMNNFITVGGNITIGDYFLSASNCSIISSSHIVDDPHYPYLKTGVTSHNEIVIGKNVFVGFGSSIIGNVKIGNGCVIGSNTVVTKSLPDYTMVVGNPARIVKIFSTERNEWINTADFKKINNHEEFLVKEINNFYQPLAAIRNNLNVY